MPYVAIKNFSVNENDYKVGDKVKKADVEDRLIRSRKIEEVKSTRKKKEKKVEQPAEQPIERGEILTEESSDVEVNYEEIGGNSLD